MRQQRGVSDANSGNPIMNLQEMSTIATDIK